MKIIIEMESRGDNLMLGIPEDVKHIEAKVTAVIIRKEVVPVLPETTILTNYHRPYFEKSYIELAIDSMKNVDTQEKTVSQLEWHK